MTLANGNKYTVNLFNLNYLIFLKNFKKGRMEK